MAFGQVLLSQGYTILHMSRHGRGEHGKDIIAKAPDGIIYTFQLKGGDINLPSWRDIRGEVEDLVRLPAQTAGQAPILVHVPVLVTNGEIVGDAAESISRYADLWEASGSGRLLVWQRGELLKMFLEAHGSFLPKERPDLKRFVQLFAADFEDRLDRPRFARLMWEVTRTFALEGKKTKSIRTIDSIILLGYYIIEQYEDAENWVAACEGWSIIAAHVMYIASKDGIPDRIYRPALDLCWLALSRNLDKLNEEVFARKDLVEPRYMFAEPLTYGSRATITLGWVAASALTRLSVSEPVQSHRIIKVLQREGKRLQFVSEADWPYVVALALFLERFVGAREADNLLNLWVNTEVPPVSWTPQQARYWSGGGVLWRGKGGPSHLSSNKRQSGS